MATKERRVSTRSRSTWTERELLQIGVRGLTNWRPGPVGDADSPYQLLDVFSGCGGMSAGFAAIARATGVVQAIGGVDLNARSLDTYSRNMGALGIQCDVSGLTAPAALKKLLRRVPAYDQRRGTILIACAPCQGFSAHRKKSWHELDPRNSLVVKAAHVAVLLQPDVLVMENVPELFSHRYWAGFREFCAIMKASGYEISQGIINAAAHGVPQERHRALVIASKHRLIGLPPAEYSPSRFRTVRSAIEELPPVSAGIRSLDDPLHRSASHRESTLRVLRSVKCDGGSRPPGVGPKCLQGFKGFADVYGRLYWDRPAITITHYARNPASGRFVHPEQHRGLTAREAARLQSFPDAYDFAGGFDDIFRQIGEAVPPRLAVAIAARVLASLLGGEPRPGIAETVDSPVSDSFASVIAGMKARRR